VGTSAKDGLAARSDKHGHILGSWCIGSCVQPVDGSMDRFLFSYISDFVEISWL
jgi:hypothetical protein